MKTIQTRIVTLVFSLLLLPFALAIASPELTYAVDEQPNNSSNSAAPDPSDKNKGGAGTCAGVKTDYFSCEGDGAKAASGLIQQIILIMSVGVGVIAVGGIVYGAILYASAQDNQEQVRKSIKVIRSVAIGIVLYIFMAVIINWLVPGGVFNTSPPTNQSQSSAAAS